jgi:uncharacterized protein (DUF2062 family)
LLLLLPDGLAVTVPNPPPSVPAKGPTLWQRRVADPIFAQFTQGITPEKIALTLAVGSACALFPILGTATLLCLVVGIVLRLNQPLIQLVNALCSVPHLLGVYALIRFGDLIFGVRQPRFTVAEFITHRPHSFPNLWAIVLTVWRDHGVYFHRIESAALHALVAWAVIAPFWIFIVYRLVHPALRRAAQRRRFLLPAPKDAADQDIVP